MKIYDLNGKAVEVTDLELAIMQADDYRHYELSDPRLWEFSKKQQSYWVDLYHKLLALKAGKQDAD